jgi:hypothetical protein
MNKLSDLLLAVRRKERPIALIASLPSNDPALAQAALEGGADVIKVHINVTHRASQTVIGGLAEERAALEEILQIWCGHPAGIVPGSAKTIHPEELAELPGMGFDFCSLYLQDAPLGVLPPSVEMERMLALSSADSLMLVEGLGDLDIQICELSIMAAETYGRPLSYHDLARYRAIRRLTQLPLVVPTQHYFKPPALPELAGAGIDGVMLGTIVCGTTPQSWREAFKRFRDAAN